MVNCKLFNDNTLFELTHPDYVPEDKPGKNTDINKIEKNVLPVFDAFNKLKISKDKSYEEFFESNKELSYKIKQPKPI